MSEPREDESKGGTATKKRSAELAGLTGCRLAVNDNSLEQQFVCPISCKLPVDPVLALDGKVYDRLYLMDWFRRNSGDTCKSPMTNEPILKTIVPATQIKSTISLLIEQGIFTQCEETVEWTRAVKEQEGWTQEFKKVVYDASQGDIPSMNRVGNNYRDGGGTTIDKKKAVDWYTRASWLGCARSTAAMAMLYLRGFEGDHNGEKQVVRGIVELARAGTLGSEFACCMVGFAHLGTHVLGSPGLQKDMAAATFWFKQSLTCSVKDAGADFMAKRDTWLKKHARC